MARPLQPYERAVLEESALPDDFDGASDPADAPQDALARAQALIEEAHEAAERKRQEGYRQGHAEGVARGREEFLASLAPAQEALHAVAHEIRQANAAFIESLSPALHALVETVVRKVLRRECRTDPTVVRAALHDALARTIDGERLKVRLNPGDFSALSDEGISVADWAAGAIALRVIPDPDIAPGGCIVESETAVVDAQVETQLQQILETLADTSSETPETTESPTVS